MNAYFIDHPLDAGEISQIARILAGMRTRTSFPSLRQYRVPGVLPAPDAAGRYALDLMRYIPVLRTHFLRVGASRRRGEAAALVFPQPATPLVGALALALRDVCGRSPYIAIRGSQADPGVRLIDLASLLDWFSGDTGDRFPRSHA
ncbi:MAG TPA: hypothetical protein VFA95_02050 [Gammaproteobacteria bacterium]|nr:hypothetical protein [Gammaproteobacteria bacterium]